MTARTGSTGMQSVLKTVWNANATLRYVSQKPMLTFFNLQSQSNRLTLQFRERSGATISPASASASQASRFILEESKASEKVEHATSNQDFQGRNCDQCQADHWGFASGTGCYPCECSDASEHGQCDQVIQ